MGSRTGSEPISTYTTTSLNPTNMAHAADPYADIDFDEITENTGLQPDEIKCLKVCFDLFDTKKVEFLSADDLGEIMRAMGFRPTEEELKELLAEIDEDGSGDMETMKRELKDAFRIYDKEGLGYITTETLRGLIGGLPEIFVSLLKLDLTVHGLVLKVFDPLQNGISLLGCIGQFGDSVGQG